MVERFLKPASKNGAAVATWPSSVVPQLLKVDEIASLPNGKPDRRGLLQRLLCRGDGALLTNGQISVANGQNVAAAERENGKSDAGRKRLSNPS
jgi:hypothetical protein